MRNGAHRHFFGLPCPLIFTINHYNLQPHLPAPVRVNVAFSRITSTHIQLAQHIADGSIRSEVAKSLFTNLAKYIVMSTSNMARLSFLLPVYLEQKIHPHTISYPLDTFHNDYEASFPMREPRHGDVDD